VHDKAGGDRDGPGLAHSKSRLPHAPAATRQWTLLQSSLTNWCLMETLLRKLGVQPGA